MSKKSSKRYSIEESEGSCSIQRAENQLIILVLVEAVSPCWSHNFVFCLFRYADCLYAETQGRFKLCLGNAASRVGKKLVLFSADETNSDDYVKTCRRVGVPEGPEHNLA